MQSFEQPPAEYDELLKRFKEKSNQGWKLGSRQLHKTLSVAVYVDNPMLHTDDQKLFSSFLIASLIADFFVARGGLNQRLIVLSDFNSEHLDIGVIKKLSKKGESDLPNSLSLHQSRNEKINVLSQKLRDYGFSPNITDIKFDTELCDYQKLLEVSYSWLRKSGGSVINDTPCFRLKSGKLLPLMRYESIIYKEAINIGWIQELCKLSDSVLVISSHENSIGEIVAVIQSDFKNLFCTLVGKTVGSQLVWSHPLTNIKLKSKYSVDPQLHLTSLFKRFNAKTHLSIDEANLILNQIGELLDFSKKIIENFQVTSQQDHVRRELISIEAQFIKAVLDYELIIQRFIDLYEINIIIDYLFHILNTYQTIISYYNSRLIRLEKDLFMHLFGAAFLALVSDLLDILGIVEG